MAKIIVQNTEITVSNVNGEDYICITDMLKAKDGDFFVTDWLRNRNTMEFLGVWERIYNPNFNYGEFATIRNQAGLPREAQPDCHSADAGIGRQYRPEPVEVTQGCSIYRAKSFVRVRRG